MSLILDLDGTILDSSKAAYKAYKPIFKKYGISLEYKDFLLSSNLFSMASEEEREEINRIWRHEYKLHLREVKVYPGAIEFLERNRNRGRKLFIATGGNRERVMNDLRRLNLNYYFYDVVTGDDVKKQKPDPEMIELIIKKHCIRKNECVFVGDKPWDVLAGKRAKVKTIAVNWDKIPELTEKLRSVGPDGIVTTGFDDLYKLVESMLGD